MQIVLLITAIIQVVVLIVLAVAIMIVVTCLHSLLNARNAPGPCSGWGIFFEAFGGAEWGHCFGPRRCAAASCTHTELPYLRSGWPCFP